MEILRKLQASGLPNDGTFASPAEDGGFLGCIAGLGSAALTEVDRPGWASDFLARDIEATSVPANSQDGRSHVHDVRAASNLDARVNRSLGNDSDLPRYTMAMNEVFDAEGRRPQYDCETLSLDPPLFEATVRHKGRAYQGKASTKKEAKHLASRNACLDQGYRL